MGLGLDFADAFVLLAFLALAGFTYLKATNPKAGPTVFAKQIIVQERDINGYLARGVAGSDGTKVDEKAEESPSSSPAESPSASSVSSDDTTKHKDNDKLKETPEEAFARPITPVTDFDWKSVQRRKFRPFKPIYHITMALRNTTPGDLITIDEDYLDRITLRRSLISSKGPAVHGVVPDSGGAAAVREMYSYLMTRNLPERYPTVFSVSEGKMHNSITGKTFPTTTSDTSDAAAAAALRVLGETVEEDLFFLTQEAAGHRCVAFICCFPSGFDPAQKLGLGLAAIHEPVPSYEKIGPSMERFFGKLEVGKPVCRLNWSVQTHGDLHNLASNHIKSDEEEEVEVDTDIDVSKTHLRVEFQTLTRLPQTRALVFSFKTYLYSLAEVKAEGRGPEMADAIEGLTKGNAPGMWRYKAAVRWGPKACEYLRS